MSAVDGFAIVVEDAVRLSEAAIGVEHTGRQNRALFVFAKLIAHCMSVEAIIRAYGDAPAGSKLLDHFSIATLGRASIDAALMTMYISEPSLTREQWDLRRQILFLHDHSNRKRFLTVLAVQGDEPPLPFFNNYDELRASLQTKIRTLARGLGYPADDVQEFTKGQRVFIAGSRAAAKEAGWDRDAFEFHQSYFSNWVHSHPVSFLRADEHGISFSQPSEFQLGFSGMVVETISEYFRTVNDRMRQFTGSIGSDPVGQLT